MPRSDPHAAALGPGDAGRHAASAGPFFGWRVVAAAFVVAVFGWGFGFYGPAIYLHAVVERTGWSVALVSGAVTLHFLAGAAVIPSLPRLYGAAGLPRVTLAGAVLLALGVIGWALAAESWQLLGAALASGAGWVSLGAAAINAMVSPWFVRKRPAALSMAYNGASIGGVIFSPLWVALIAGFGFPLAALGAGLVMVAFVTLLAFGVLAWTPSGKGQLPDGEAPGLVRADRRGRRSRRFPPGRSGATAASPPSRAGWPWGSLRRSASSPTSSRYWRRCSARRRPAC
ncbi:MFS transporter [Enterovirga sp. CN4-39]|uniref:MFS transporter n=1 Tax=Enterovirga sp. CN4-39 TaxID=3400910 RepID=UPI003C10728C